MKTLFKLPKKADASTLLGADYLCWMEVAENDDNGVASGKAGIISFGEILTMEAKNFVGYGFRSSYNHKGHRRVHISNVIYPFYKKADWFGNMIWSGYQVTAVSATAIINQLHKSGKWDATSGDSELLEHIEKGGLLTGDFIRIHKDWEDSRF